MNFSPSRPFVSFINIASRLYNQASGLTASNLLNNVPTGGTSSAALFVAAAATAGGTSSSIPAPPPPSHSGAAVGMGGISSTQQHHSHHHFEPLRRTDPTTSNNDRFYSHRGVTTTHRHRDNSRIDDSITTLRPYSDLFESATALNSAQQQQQQQAAGSLSLPPFAQSLIPPHLRYASKTTSSGITMQSKLRYYYRLHFFPKRLRCLSAATFKLRLNRLNVLAIFDRNSTLISGMTDVILGGLVALLAALLISRNIYTDFSLIIFAFVVAASQVFLYFINFSIKKIIISGILVFSSQKRSTGCRLSGAWLQLADCLLPSGLFLYSCRGRYSVGCFPDAENPRRFLVDERFRGLGVGVVAQMASSLSDRSVSILAGRFF